MTQSETPLDLAAARKLASDLNEKLEPIAKRPVDINDPAWAEKVLAVAPLDEAGIRQEAEGLMRGLLAAYASGNARLRNSIRKLLSDNPAFAWGNWSVGRGDHP